MPQLNPAPWFATLVFTWLVFLAILPPKVTAHTFPKEPTLKDPESSDTKALTWTWTWQQPYSTNS